jgi:hypothetical protein
MPSKKKKKKKNISFEEQIPPQPVLSFPTVSPQSTLSVRGKYKKITLNYFD